MDRAHHETEKVGVFLYAFVEGKKKLRKN